MATSQVLQVLPLLGAASVSSVVAWKTLRQKNVLADTDSKESSGNMPRADEIDVSTLYTPEQPSKPPKHTFWDLISGSFSQQEIWNKLSANADRKVVNRGRISHYTVNQYAANDPIEDSFAIRTQLHTTKLSGQLFGVFDGHSGEKTSHFCRDELFDFIEYCAATTAAFDPLSIGEEYQLIPPSDAMKTELYTHSYLPLTKAFELADATYLSSSWLNGQNRYGSMGACAVVSHIDKDWITTAWAGDCRAVIGRKVTPQQSKWARSTHTQQQHEWQAVGLTQDHQIDMNEKERQRLLTEHPNEPDIIWRNRVKGRLQPTRVFGDGHYKRMEYFSNHRMYSRMETWTPPYVTAKPDISYYKLQKEDQFLVMSTDGLFQDLSNDEVVKAVGHILDNEADKNVSTGLVKETLLAAGRHLPLNLYSREFNLTNVLNLPKRMKRNIHDDITVLVLFFSDETGLLSNESDDTNLEKDATIPPRLEQLLKLQNSFNVSNPNQASQIQSRL